MSFKKVFICIGIVLLLCSCLPPDSQKEENPSGGLDVPEGVLLLEEDRTYTLPENAMYALFLCLPQEDQNYGFDGSNETEFSSSDFAKVSLHFTSPRIKGAEFIRDRHSDSLPLLTPKIPGTYENNGNLVHSGDHVFEIGDVWEDVYLYLPESRSADVKCVYITENVYVMIEEDVEYDQEDLDDIKVLVDDFEKVYPRFKEIFGPYSDIDKNGKLIAVFGQWDETVIGYQSTADFFNDEETDGMSNEGDVIYLSLNAVQSPDSYFNELTRIVMVHELQHQVFSANRWIYSQPFDFSMWITEGLSSLAEAYSGRDEIFKKRVCDLAMFFIDVDGDNSLIEWRYDEEQAYSYALSAMFFNYLKARFGEEIIQKIYTCPYNDYRMIEHATGEDFGTLFYDFCMMVVTTGRGLTDDPRYDVKEFYDGSLGFDMSDMLSYCLLLPDLPDYDFNMKPYSLVVFLLNDAGGEISFESEGTRVLGIIV